MSLTSAQQEAVVARGNVLVVAGAGTGKTTTLVERCLACLLDEKTPASLEEILMVTFTDAAAAEMRHRIRTRLEEKLAAQPDELRWQEQLALFDMAHIGTLHSFCLQLLRQHFYELELDPQLTVMPEEEAHLLAEETLGDILREHYKGDTEFAPAVQQLIQSHGRGWDKPVRALVMRLHHYTQTLRNPEGWFDAQLAMFASPEPVQWREWLVEGVRDWRERWLPALEVESGNARAQECVAALEELTKLNAREACARVLAKILELGRAWSAEKRARPPKKFEGFFEEAAFLGSLARTGGKNDPLAEDWGWVRGQMSALLRLARDFTKSFGDAKRELGMVDFHDLEQHALRLLWDRDMGQLTAVAHQWREKLRFVFVDEYQDINDAQDAIIKALSREGAKANRFLVGDVKQSIYRFRLANPHIFLNYAATWRGAAGRTIPLVDNFRSREMILNFVNALFGGLMRPEIGGVAYNEEARLKFGDAENRAVLSATDDISPCVEIRLCPRGGESSGGGEESAEGEAAGSVDESGREARMIAVRLRELKSGGHLIWDEEKKSTRAVEWGDMAVLLRSPSGKAEMFAREFARAGVPLVVARSGFYDSMEVLDLLSLLRVLDNPLQDLPLLAALRSPLAGLTIEELASIRLALPKGSFWAALQRYHTVETKHAGWPKVERFLKNYADWRRLARQASLSRCLEAVLDGTHYADWLLTQPRGGQRQANVKRLLALAQQFDRFQRQGLFRFLKFVEAQQTAEIGPETAKVAEGNSVTLMSIHQSKGLEFPVVVVADLGKAFNLADVRAEIILDEEFGLCPQIKPPHTGNRYPSLPYWLARQRQKKEILGEELRLLYVATTRARDLLILSGSAAAKKIATVMGADSLTTAGMLNAKNCLDWILAWADQAGAAEWRGEAGAAGGENGWWRWAILGEAKQNSTETAAVEGEPAGEDERIDAAVLAALRQRLAWRYGNEAATHLPAKTSVTVLRRQMEDEDEAEALPLFRFGGGRSRVVAEGSLTAQDIGTAHHKFLQLVSLERTASGKELREEARRMREEQMLSEAEAASLDFKALAVFWESELGGQIRKEARRVRRELAFTARFSPEELRLDKAGESTAGEFIVVQGIADLAVILPKEIWLVDFKTDEIREGELEERARMYQPQMQLYAMALERIYGRPVSRAYLHFLALGKSVAVERVKVL